MRVVMGKFKDLTGQKFGRLFVIGLSTEPSKRTRWICKCDCRNITTVLGYNLTSGCTKSCGCLHRETISNPNIYELHDNYGKCFLSCGDYFLFDLDDYEKLRQFTWVLGTKGYVVGRNGNTTIRSHRLIMNCPNNMVVDHINHNKLDNRKENLRICTVGQNNLNKGQYKNRKEKMGVRKDAGKWRATITKDKQDIYLGRFDTYEEAVNARLLGEQKYFGEFAYRN